MDMRKYAIGFIRPDDVRGGPLRETIAGVSISEKFECPVLVFESGNEFTLFSYSDNLKAILKAYGYESEDWKGHIVELSLGTYIDKKDGDKEKETVDLTPVSSRDGNDDGPPRVDPAKILPPPKRTGTNDMEDEIPY